MSTSKPKLLPNRQIQPYAGHDALKFRSLSTVLVQPLRYVNVNYRVHDSFRSQKTLEIEFEMCDTP
jgi:hypothetical protein